MNVSSAALAKTAWRVAMAVANKSGDQVVRWDHIPVELRTEFTMAVDIVSDTGAAANMANLRPRLRDQGWTEGIFSVEEKRFILAGDSPLSDVIFEAIAAVVIAVKEL